MNCDRIRPHVCDALCHGPALPRTRSPSPPSPLHPATTRPPLLGSLRSSSRVGNACRPKQPSIRRHGGSGPTPSTLNAFDRVGGRIPRSASSATRRVAGRASRAKTSLTCLTCLLLSGTHFFLTGREPPPSPPPAATPAAPASPCDPLQRQQVTQSQSPCSSGAPCCWPEAPVRAVARPARPAACRPGRRPRGSSYTGPGLKSSSCRAPPLVARRPSSSTARHGAAAVRVRVGGQRVRERAGAPCS